jgi:hypothetical protein
VRCYVPGVGTGNPLDKLQGGLTGTGLSRALLKGYRFLADKYLPGDRISLFDFSRGAYTARSLAGMIGRVGIVDGRASMKSSGRRGRASLRALPGAAGTAEGAGRRRGGSGGDALHHER